MQVSDTYQLTRAETVEWLPTRKLVKSLQVVNPFS